MAKVQLRTGVGEAGLLALSGTPHLQRCTTDVADAACLLVCLVGQPGGQPVDSVGAGST